MLYYRHTESLVLVSKIACLLELGEVVVAVVVAEVKVMLVHRELVGEGSLGELVAQCPQVLVMLKKVEEGTTMIRVRVIETRVLNQPLLALVLLP